MKKTWLIALAPAFFVFSACNSTGGPAPASLTASSVGDVKPPNPTSTATTTPVSAPTTPSGFSSCASSAASGGACLAVNFMTFNDSSSQPVIDAANAERIIQAANNIWKQCKIQFEIESYEAIDPAKYGLSGGTSVQNELGQIRQTFDEPTRMLVVLTDSWQSNYLGWTEMPGGTANGSIIDGAWVMNNGLSGEVAVAHELGHYVGLDHVQDTSDLMYPAAVASAVTLNSDQCALANSTIQQYWQAMERR